MKGTSRNGASIGTIILWIITALLVLLAISVYLDQLAAVREGEELLRTIAQHNA